MRKHFVTFLSPGTFISEQTVKKIKRWDVDLAIKISRTIEERYGAIPYGFYFTTESFFGEKVIKQSPMYFLGGKVRTYEEVVEENNPDEGILRSNMKANNFKKVITNTNSWKITLPLESDDVVLDYHQ